MAIKMQTLLTQKSKKFGASSQSLDWQQMVLDAANYVLDDIEARVGKSTTHVDNISDSIDLDKQRYGPVVSLGIDYYLNSNTAYQVMDERLTEARYFNKLKTSQMSYLKTLDLSAKFGEIT